MTELPDIQNEEGDYGYDINAGVNNILLPIHIKDSGGNLINTVAKVSLLVRLSRRYRGINMSRIPQLLSEVDNTKWVGDLIEDICVEACQRLKAESSEIVLQFPYFYTKTSPVSDNHGKAYVDVIIAGKYKQRLGAIIQKVLRVKTPVTLLCPCSKEISAAGAHNQRAIIDITAEYGRDMVWIEDLIEYSEDAASAPIYPILKRPDEKHVTEMAYDNPAFVEDALRKVTHSLMQDRRISYFSVAVESQESIHQHNAIAEVNYLELM